MYFLNGRRVTVATPLSRVSFCYEARLNRYYAVLVLTFLVSLTSILATRDSCAQSHPKEPSSERTLASLLNLPPRPNPMPINIGAGMSGVFNAHTTDIPMYRRGNDVTIFPLSGSIVCADFKGGNSVLPDAWLLYERPLGSRADRSFWMAPRLHFSAMSAPLITTGKGAVHGRNPDDSSLVAVGTEHQLKASLFGLGADLFVKYPLPASMFVFAGPSVYWLIRSDQEESERITEPSNAVFSVEGTSVRTTQSGPIPNVRKLQSSFTVGGNVDVGLSFRREDGSPLVMLTPEASITFPLSEIRKDATWHLTRVMVGASLKFDVSQPPALPQEIIVQREPEAPKPIGRISADLKLSGVIDSVGHEIEVPTLQLRVEEIEQVDRFPLLNSVFFDHGKSTLPDRYTRLSPSEVDSFKPQQLAELADLARYHQVLNIFGRRMRLMPETKVTLIGAAPKEVAGATGTPASKTLGLERAEAIKNYLVSVWGIDPSRLPTEQREFPPNPSTTGTPEGVEENDRVVLSTDDMRILTPIRMTSVERSLNTPKLRIRTTYTSRFPLNLYSLSLTQGDQVLAQFNSAHDIQDWTPTQSQLPSTNEPLAITLSLRDSVGTTFIARDSARVEQITVKRKREERVLDRIIERYNLVTFDFDKAELDARSRAIVDTIARHVSAGDRIKLRGYTDLLGDPAHNLLLSENRAKAVTEALKQAIGPELAQTVTIDAAGEGRANLVDNRYPEGRFLSRTVQITIDRPIQ